MSERKSARRAKILESAEKLFAQNGFENASIRDIAKISGVADGTIYNYFENKEAIFHELVRNLLERLGKDEALPLGISEGTDFSDRVLARMRRLHDEYLRIAAVLPYALSSPDLRLALKDSFIAPVAAALERELEMADHATGARALEARVLLAAVLGFQVLMLLGDPLTVEAWTKPARLAQVWARFIQSASERP
jgi:AcrR family transcriptional regulator